MSQELSPQGFALLADFFEAQSGIQLRPEKRLMVAGRLMRRAQIMGCSLDDYARRVVARPQDPEAVILTDLLTTNETYFFREPQHFEHLIQTVRSSPGSAPLRVWSAAASSGEEAYSIALTLARCAGNRPWEVLGTDLSTRVVAQARTGLYSEERCTNIPMDDRKRWCLKGQGAYEGTVLMSRELRAKVRFQEGNLMEPMPQLGMFDVVFLRNVLIYFQGAAKAQVVNNVLQQLKVGGVFYISHTENLHGVPHQLQRVSPAIYLRVH